MMKKIAFGWLMVCSIVFSIKAQPTFNANSIVPIYKGQFAYGTNMGFYKGYNNNAPSDILIADLVARAGLGTIRLALYDDFLTRYGADVRESEFSYYNEQLHLSDLTLFLNDPHPSHQEMDTLTCVHKSLGVVEKFRDQVFRNLYTPIWDGGKNGTPINDTNYYAAYVYSVVKDYGNHIKFYEVWNEPDFAANNNCTLASGIPGNWLDNNPAPCDLVNLRAEITSYIRMLRITYEIVKTYYPDSYVATGGIGFPNFLDAVLRNTDNPDQGKVTAEYPLKGGAWFDVLSFHSYPQYTLRYWNSALKKFVYNRYSDKAVSAVFELRDRMRDVLHKYAYDGNTFPEKPFLLTEVNVPRKSYSNYDFIGSEEAQTNTMMKLFVLAQKEQLMQVYAYTIGDTQDESLSTGNQQGMDLMGFYYNLNKATPTSATLTPTGVGVKGLSLFLKDFNVDYIQTQALNLPSTVDGVVFVKDNKVKMALWSKTEVDSSEFSTASYSLPVSFNFDSIQIKHWDYVKTGDSTVLHNRTLVLNGSVLLIELLGNVKLSQQETNSNLCHVFPNPSKKEFYISMNNTGCFIANVYDIQGNSLFYFSGKGNLNHFKISMPTVSSGIYLLVLQTQKGTIRKKILFN